MFMFIKEDGFKAASILFGERSFNPPQELAERQAP
jgi:hypothetical protein